MPMLLRRLCVGLVEVGGRYWKNRMEYRWCCCLVVTWMHPRDRGGFHCLHWLECCLRHSILIHIPGHRKTLEFNLVSSRVKITAIYNIAHLLRMTNIRVYNMISTTNIMLNNWGISSTGGKPMLVPGECSYSCTVSIQ